MYDIKKIREQFPMLKDKTMQGQPLVFLDNASTTFKPLCVVKAIEQYYTEETANHQYRTLVVQLHQGAYTVYTRSAKPHDACQESGG